MALLWLLMALPPAIAASKQVAASGALCDACPVAPGADEQPVCVGGVSFRHRCLADCSDFGLHSPASAGACAGAPGGSCNATRRPPIMLPLEALPIISCAGGNHRWRQRRSNRGHAAAASRDSSLEPDALHSAQEMHRFHKEGFVLSGALELSSGPSGSPEARRAAMRCGRWAPASQQRGVLLARARLPSLLQLQHFYPLELTTRWASCVSM
jgi:hypothetical protein